eukprot:5286672-Pleurochrysis_carterae.AAC.1
MAGKRAQHTPRSYIRSTRRHAEAFTLHGAFSLSHTLSTSDQGASGLVAKARKAAPSHSHQMLGVMKDVEGLNDLEVTHKTYVNGNVLEQ